MVKRILGGVTYNTATSTLIATAEWEDHDQEVHEQHLYQTKGGAFWLLASSTAPGFRDSETREWVQPKPRTSVEPMSRDQAHGWMMQGELEVFHNPFDDPPEAVDEGAPAATVYMRVPATLKDALEKAAKSEGMSLNSWMLRCSESCLKAQAKTKEGS